MKYMALLTIESDEETKEFSSVNCGEIMFSKLLPLNEIFLDNITSLNGAFNLTRGELRKVFETLGGL